MSRHLYDAYTFMIENASKPGQANQQLPQPGLLSPERTILAQFYTRITISPAFSRLSVRSQALITGYLTTDATERELAKAVQRSQMGTDYKIKTGIRRVWPHLPEDVQEEYQSPEYIIALRAHAQEQRRRQATSKLATRRWQRQREQQQQMNKSTQ